MNDRRSIVAQVYAAKDDLRLADKLIGSYMPFIKAETAKYLNRPAVAGHDDELSIAMIAFHEAIGGYSRSRGAFLKYAALTIRSRLIDYGRRERRHGDTLPLDTPEGEEGTLGDTLAADDDHPEGLASREATRAEIEELARQMSEFGVSLGDVAENCPKQKRTLDACRKALFYARSNPELLDEMLQTKRLPLGKLTAGGGVERKTLERHRKYLVALLLIYTNGYEIIRGHLVQVMEGGTVR